MPRPKKANRADGRYEIKRTIGRDIGGKGIRLSFYGKDKAEAEAAYRAFIEDKTRKEKERERILFEAWAERWLELYKRGEVKDSSFDSTYERPCRRHIIPHFKGRTLRDISPLDIREFLTKKNDLSQSTLDKLRICLRGIFETAIDNELLDRNPCRNIKAKSKAEKTPKRVYDEESYAALLTIRCEYSLFAHILLYMGLRASELCGLRWEDIDLEKGILSVRQALTYGARKKTIDEPKSDNSRRRLPIPEPLLEELSEAKGEGYVVTTKKGGTVTPSNLNEQQLRYFYNRAGVPEDQRLSAHELRHTCGTMLYKSTKDIYHVSRFLGHSDISITAKIYVHDEMQDEVVHIDFMT